VRRLLLVLGEDPTAVGPTSRVLESAHIARLNDRLFPIAASVEAMSGHGVPEAQDGLLERVARRDSGLLLFGMTPPRRLSTYEERQHIADVMLQRLSSLDLHGLILYDIADETDRNANERPFPYLPTVDPADFYADHLSAWIKPVVVYRCVGKYSSAEIESWLRAQDPATVATVFVGAPSRSASVATTLETAQGLWSKTRPKLVLGGVAIPERHSARRQEHQRLIAKQVRGCSFFVTQVVYDINAAKDLISDYHYGCLDAGTDPVPIIFTVSVCGSMRTLEFLCWLGVDVPRWMENALAHASDTLSESYAQCVATARELATFCGGLRMPYGFNVESVSNRKAEIETTIRLAAEIRQLLP
jgi:Methylenetetrahydrofolate reductase